MTLINPLVGNTLTPFVVPSDEQRLRVMSAVVVAGVRQTEKVRWLTLGARRCVSLDDLDLPRRVPRLELAFANSIRWMSPKTCARIGWGQGRLS